MEKSRFFLVYAMPLVLAGAILGLAVVVVRSSAARPRSVRDRLLLQVLDLVEHHYVEPRPRDELVREAIDGIVRHLDSYSAFLDRQETRAAEEDNRGQFGGLGFHVRLDSKTRQLVVVRPFRHGPAREAGLLPGDVLVAVDGERLPAIRTVPELNDVIARIKGAVGTTVSLTVRRPVDGKPVEITRQMKRAVVQVETVVATRMVDPARGLGYLRITSFKERTARELDRALDRLLAQGLQGLIIDLRKNGGGLLRRSADVADRFLAPEGVIVSTRGRDPADNESLVAKTKPRIDPRIPIVVLINRGSASAAEAVAGALQDYHRAVLVGERSYGKGVVQSVYRMPRTGTSLKITTSRYYTPAGRCIDRLRSRRDRQRYSGGIIPNLVVKLTREEEQAVMGEGGEWDRWLADEVDPRTPSPPPTYPDSQDRQLHAATALLRGAFVLGRTHSRRAEKRAG